MIEILLLSIMLSALTDMYVHYIYCRPFRKKRTCFLCYLPTVCVIALSAILVAKPSDLGVVSVLVLCITVPKYVAVIVSILLRIFPFFRKNIVLSACVCSAAGLFLLGCTVYGATEGIRHFQVTETALHYDTLPESFDGYRIVQISDIHSGSWPQGGGALADAVGIINGLDADLVLFTGDIVNARADELLGTMGTLGKISARDGVFSVLGNHDYGTYARWDTVQDEAANLDSLYAREAAMGWRLLDNSHAIIRRGADSIALLGVQNGGEPPFPDYSDLPEAMKGTEGMFKVLMSHDPTHWKREVLPDTDIELTLSGHTHDMQFSVLGFSPAKYFYPQHKGLYMEEGRALYVNVGLGYLLPIRLGAWPEITVITLCRP